MSINSEAMGVKTTKFEGDASMYHQTLREKREEKIALKAESLSKHLESSIPSTTLLSGDLLTLPRSKGEEMRDCKRESAARREHKAAKKAAKYTNRIGKISGECTNVVNLMKEEVGGKVIVEGESPRLWSIPFDTNNATPNLVTFEKRMLLVSICKTFNANPHVDFIDMFVQPRSFVCKIPDALFGLELVLFDLEWSNADLDYDKCDQGFSFTEEAGKLYVSYVRGKVAFHMVCTLAIFITAAFGKKDLKGLVKQSATSIWIRWLNEFRLEYRKAIETAYTEHLKTEASWKKTYYDDGGDDRTTELPTFHSVLPGSDDIPMEGNMQSIFGVKKAVEKTADDVNDIRKSLDKISGGLNLNCNVDPSIKDALENISNAVEALANKDLKVNHKVDIAFPMFDGLKSITDPWMEKLKGFLPEDPVQRRVVIVFLIACVFVWVKQKKQRKYTYGGLTILVALSQYMEEEYIRNFCLTLLGVTAMEDIAVMAWAYFCEEDEDEDDPTPMEANADWSVFTDDIAAPSLVGALITVLIPIVWGQSDHGVCFEKALWTSVLYKKYSDGLSFSVKTLSAVFMDVVNALTGPLGIQLFRQSVSDYPQIYAIGDRLVALKQKFMDGGRILRTDYDEYKRVIRELDALDKMLPNTDATRIYREQIRYHRMMQTYLDSKFKLSGVSLGGYRVRPFSYTLVGPSSVGKTGVLNAVADILMPFLIGEDEMVNYRNDPDAYRASVKPEMEFHDDIKNGVEYLVIDDFCQMVNTSKDPKICHGNFLIGLNNNEPKSVNQAFAKGEVWFTPKMIALSTNLRALPDDLSVVDKMAVLTRMGVIMKVQLKPEYRLEYKNANGVCNPDWDYRLAPTVTGWNPDVYEFVGMPFKGGHAVQEPLMPGNYDFKGFVLGLSAAYLDHQVKQEVIMHTVRFAGTMPEANPFHGMDYADSVLMAIDYGQEKGYQNGSLLGHIGAMKGMVPDVYKKLEGCLVGFYFPSLLFDLDEDDIDDVLTCKCNTILSAMSGSHAFSGSKDWARFRKAYISTCKQFPMYVDEDFHGEEEQKKIDKEVGTWVDLKYGTVKTVVPKSSRQRFKDALGCHIERTHDGQILANDLYDVAPDFWDEYIKKQAEYDTWMAASMVKGSLYMTADRMDPRKWGPIAYKLVAQTFSYVMACTRRSLMTPVQVLQLFREKGTWSSAMRNGVSLVTAQLQQACQDTYGLLQTGFYSFCYGVSPSPVALGLAVAAIPLISNFFSSEAPTKMMMAANSSLKIKFKRKATKKNPVKTEAKVVSLPVDTPHASVPQGGNANIYTDMHRDVSRKINNNTYTLSVNEKPLTQIVAIRDRDFLLNDHTVQALNETTKETDVFALTSIKGHYIEFLRGSMLNITRFPNNDLALWTLPDTAISARPSILKHFIDSGSIRQGDANVRVLLNYWTYDTDGVRTVSQYPIETWRDCVQYNNRFPMAVYSYTIPGFPSACMSSLILADDRYKDHAKIIGFHSAGSLAGYEYKGSATMVTKHTMEQMLNVHHGGEEEPIIVPDDTPLEGDCDRIPSKHSILGKKPFLSMGSFSKFKKTKFFEFMGEGTNKKVPSISEEYSVNDGDFMDPMKTALEKHGNNVPAINPQLMDVAYAMFKHTWDLSLESDHIPQKWSFEDAVHGRDLVGGDKRDSSVGVSLRLRNITKKDMYGTDPVRVTDSPLMCEIKSDCMKTLDLMEQGVVPEWVTLCFGKSELLPIEKVENGKVRLIFGAEHQQVMIEKMLLGSLQSAAIRGSIRNGLAMGVNPYSMDWDAIARIFKHLNCHAGDQSGWDTHFYQWIWSYFSKWISDYYYNATPRERMARKTLVSALSKLPALVSLDGESWVIKLVESSLFSGCFSTQLAGSFGHQLLQRYVYLMDWCASKGLDHLSYTIISGPKPDIERLEHNLFILTLSDDVVVGVREHLFEYNVRSVARNMARIGFKYTPADKKGDFTEDFTPFEDIQFLKRKFVWCSLYTRYIGPIDTDSIIHALYWSEIPAYKLLPVIDTMLQEASLHGKAYFDEFKSKILERARKTGVEIASVYLDYGLALAMVLNTDYAPWGENLIDIDGSPLEVWEGLPSLC